MPLRGRIASWLSLFTPWLLLAHLPLSHNSKVHPSRPKHTKNLLIHIKHILKSLGHKLINSFNHLNLIKSLEQSINKTQRYTFYIWFYLFFFSYYIVFFLLFTHQNIPNQQTSHISVAALSPCKSQSFTVAITWQQTFK